MKKTIKPPIGISDFKELREDGYYFVDKSLFIKEIIGTSAKVILLPRPRRFGKTLNLSMLRYFFEKTESDTASLFDGLAIQKDDVFKVHQGKYPVIFLTFKDLKQLNWPDCLTAVKEIIFEEYSRHRYLLEGNVLFREEKKYVTKILNKEGTLTDYSISLKNLSNYLDRFHKVRPIILIDEYDTPIISGYNYGYYDDVINFMRNFLSGGLKDNSNLFKGVLTGILRVAKESIFSGLNNLGVFTLIKPEFSKIFGFTVEETKGFLSDMGIPEKYDDVSLWYNGYLFGDQVIYNPWSVLNFADSKDKVPRPHWVNTASTELIDKLATREGKELREEIGLLLEGKPITKSVYESIVMRDLNRRDDLLWSFLLFSGYLKPVKRIDDELYQLQIPNQEVKTIYRDLVKTWFAEKVESNKLEEMLISLKDGDIEKFEYYLADLVEKILSFHDIGGKEPEKFYHAFVLGLLVWLSGEYDIKSNRESGLGRYDVVLIPKDRNRQGIIMEFKKINKRKNETPEQTLDNALKQIEDKKYALEFESAGIEKIIKIAVAFQGKELWMKTA